MPPTLLVCLAIAFAALWRRLALKEAAAQLKRIEALEAAIAALVANPPVTWDKLSPRLDKIFGRVNAARSDLESLDAVLVATGILKQPVVVRREREPT